MICTSIAKTLGARGARPHQSPCVWSMNTCSLASHMLDRLKSMNVLSSSIARAPAARASGWLPPRVRQAWWSPLDVEVGHSPSMKIDQVDVKTGRRI